MVQPNLLEHFLSQTAAAVRGLSEGVPQGCDWFVLRRAINVSISVETWVLYPDPEKRWYLSNTLDKSDIQKFPSDFLLHCTAKQLKWVHVFLQPTSFCLRNTEQTEYILYLGHLVDIQQLNKCKLRGKLKILLIFHLEYRLLFQRIPETLFCKAAVHFKTHFVL